MRKLVAVVLSVAALTASALFAATPARADWANTRWGMSKAQVLALYPDAQPSLDGLVRRAPIEFDRMTWSAVGFEFGDNGLQLVVLSTDATFDELRSALAARYGAPVRETGRRGDFIYILYFRAAGAGDEVWITDGAGRRSVGWGPSRRAPAP